MSVLIKGMDMPKDCGKCFVGDRAICSSACPLVPVPPHGRLIDESDAITALLCDNDYAAALTVGNCPTVIPAELPKEES